MSEMDSVPVPGTEHVAEEELLARFVFGRSMFANGRLKPAAFVPHPYRELSVTRHAGCTEEEVWEAGADVARRRNLELVGRADVSAGQVRELGLDVVPDPPPPSHANIIGWAEGKTFQKAVAAKLALASLYLSRTPISPPDQVR